MWTETDIAKLRELAKAGRSYADAARALGTTRNAIAGKAHREGIIFKCSAERRSANCSAGAKRAWDSMKPLARKRRLVATIQKAQAANRAKARARRSPQAAQP